MLGLLWAVILFCTFYLHLHNGKATRYLASISPARQDGVGATEKMNFFLKEKHSSGYLHVQKIKGEKVFYGIVDHCFSTLDENVSFTYGI